MSDEYTITVQESARQSIARMTERVDQLGNAFGRKSDEYVKAEHSLRNALAHLFGMGEVRIWRDGHLSLAGVTGYGLSFGMVFHRKHRHCTVDGCKAFAEAVGEGAHVYWFGTERTEDHEHVWSYPLTAPTPGDWSFHS